MKPDTDDSKDYILPSKEKKVVVPQADKAKSDPAVELIRQKIDYLYKDEPSAQEELSEAESAGQKRSKHQQFMHELSHSGKSLAEIQTAWHNYYVGLPDNEKHEVWQEFYAEHGHNFNLASPKPASNPEPQTPEKPRSRPRTNKPRATKKATEQRSTAEIKQQLTQHIAKRGKLQAKDHARSLLFGLGVGAIAIVILLFGFFNERFIAPFITPSRRVSSTPILIDPNSTTAGSDPELIIPKINLEVPVVYNEPSIEEAAVEGALENGVVHYATTPNPGETGNGVIFGHSSNNILNKGKYKFAFVLLKRLENGDTFMIQKDGKRYVYKVFDKKIVKPSEVSVLGRTDKPSTFTLITCDPPGTSINRLVVIGEQISPDPGTNIASKVDQNSATKPQTLPSNSESLWHRLTQWLAG
jgi:sortase A